LFNKHYYKYDIIISVPSEKRVTYPDLLQRDGASDIK